MSNRTRYTTQEVTESSITPDVMDATAWSELTKTLFTYVTLWTREGLVGSISSRPGAA